MALLASGNKRGAVGLTQAADLRSAAALQGELERRRGARHSAPVAPYFAAGPTVQVLHCPARERGRKVVGDVGKDSAMAGALQIQAIVDAANADAPG